MGLVDHQEPDALHQKRQQVFDEPGVRESLRRDQEDIHAVAFDQVDEGVEAVVRPGVEGADPEPHPFAGLYLVAHERDQW